MEDFPSISRLLPARKSSNTKTDPSTYGSIDGKFQVMKIRLSQDILELLTSNVASDGLQVVMGDRKGIQIGDEFFPFSTVEEPSEIDIYKPNGRTVGKGDNTPILIHQGSISHKINISAGASSTALSRLKSRNEDLKKEKEASKATILERAPPKNASGMSTLAGRRAPPPLIKTSSRPSTPAFGERSPAFAPGSPALSGPINLQTAPMQSLPVRLLHLLALGPSKETALVQRTHGSPVDVVAFLKQHAQLANGSLNEYVLRDSAYKSLRLWEFKPYSPRDRQAVINNATEAFDRLDLPSDHLSRLRLKQPKQKSVKASFQNEERESGSMSPASLTREGTPISPSVQANLSDSGKAIGKQQSSTTNKKSAVKRPPAAGNSSTNSNIGKKKPKKATKILSSEYVSSDDEVSVMSAASSTSSSPRKNTGERKSKVLVISSDSPKKTEKAAVDPGSTPALGHSKRKSDTLTVSGSIDDQQVKRIRNDSGYDSSSSTGAGIAHKKAKRKADMEKAKNARLGLPDSTKKAVANSTNVRTISKDVSSGDDDRDLYMLAERFTQQYERYAKLYDLVERQLKEGKSGLVHELSRLHNRLKRWKQKLWAADPSSSDSETHKVINKKGTRENGKANSRKKQGIVSSGDSKRSTKSPIGIQSKRPLPEGSQPSTPTKRPAVRSN